MISINYQEMAACRQAALIIIDEAEHKETACHYLFGKEAETVFPNFGGKEATVNKCLELLMRVNVYFLTHRDGYLFDVMSKNTQCHLFSMKFAQIMDSYKDNKEKMLIARTQENRFLHLGMFLNFAFLSRIKLFEKAVQKVMDEVQPYKSSTQSYRRTGLRDVRYSDRHQVIIDVEGYRETAARHACIEVFKAFLQQDLKSAKNENSINQELYQLSLLEDDLMIAPYPPNLNLAKIGKEQKVYTFPHFAGTVCVVDFIVKHKIAVVLKAKVMSKEGFCGTVSAHFGDIKKGEGVLVYEAMFTDGSYKVSKFRDFGKSCSNYYFDVKRKLHKKDVTCTYCTQNPNKVDLMPYKKRLETLIQDIDHLKYTLLANAVGCTQGKQEKFLKYFNDKEKFPNLSDLFAKAVSFCKEFGIADSDFAFCHGYYTTEKRAASDEFVLDQNPEQFMQLRGLIS